jgi:hypothetical protein
LSGGLFNIEISQACLIISAETELNNGVKGSVTGIDWPGHARAYKRHLLKTINDAQTMELFNLWNTEVFPNRRVNEDGSPQDGDLSDSDGDDADDDFTRRVQQAVVEQKKEPQHTIIQQDDEEEEEDDLGGDSLTCRGT